MDYDLHLVFNDNSNINLTTNMAAELESEARAMHLDIIVMTFWEVFSVRFNLKSTFVTFSNNGNQIESE